ncbi:MAG TPA: GNAT family N-acetyltransferase [Chryseolinea sp.]
MVALNIPEQILTDRLSLHRLRYEDAEEIFYTYASKAEVTRFLSWPTHQSLKDTNAFLRYAIAAWEKGTDYSFAIRLKESNRLIGSIGVINENGKLQFGYVFSPTQWNKGYATEVCLRLMKLLKRQPGVYRIQSFVDAENVSSARVLIKSGLVEEARLARWFRFVNQNNEAKDCILFKLPLDGHKDRSE